MNSFIKLNYLQPSMLYKIHIHIWIHSPQIMLAKARTQMYFCTHAPMFPEELSHLTFWYMSPLKTQSHHM